MDLKERNQWIIDAVVRKAERDCPGALAMVGIYGSFQTGDVHEKSDLDLLILINDDRGWQLGSTFIQEDLQVGHDLYCTTWRDLERDAAHPHANISKLMNAKIVWHRSADDLARLEALREEARTNLEKPDTFEAAEEQLRMAEQDLGRAMIEEDMDALRALAGDGLFRVECALALLNGRYFRYGTRRVFEELGEMEHRPVGLRQMAEALASAASPEELRQALTALVRETVRVFDQVQKGRSEPKQPVSPDNLRGTYEEMFSNWRNKMYFAAERGDLPLAFAAMTSFTGMVDEIRRETDVVCGSPWSGFDPGDLEASARNFDAFLEGYLENYRKAGLPPRRYRDIDAFLENYLK